MPENKLPPVPPALIAQLRQHAVNLFVEAALAAGMLKAFAPNEADAVLRGADAAIASLRGDLL